MDGQPRQILRKNNKNQHQQHIKCPAQAVLGLIKIKLEDYFKQKSRRDREIFSPEFTRVYPEKIIS